MTSAKGIHSGKQSADKCNSSCQHGERFGYLVFFTDSDFEFDEDILVGSKTGMGDVVTVEDLPDVIGPCRSQKWIVPKLLPVWKKPRSLTIAL